MLGCDLVVAAGKEALGVMAHGRTRVVLNSEETITGAFTRDPNFRIQGLGLSGIVKDVAGKEQVEVVPATQLATGLLGDSIGTNLFMVGYAWQQGLIPVSAASIDRAIELNCAAVEMNRTAFRLGRLAAADRAAVEALLPRPQAGSPPGHRIESRSLDEIVSRRTAFLASYQNARYAGEYRALVERVRAREKAVTGKEGRLSEAVARYLFKLMAYKDEYEVARLYSDGTFRRQLAETFDGKGRLTFHLAPPLLAKRDPNTGEPAKMAFGPWMMTAFGALAKFRFLRGTAFDPFGYTAERRTERALIGEYRHHIEAALEALSAQGHAAAVAIAEVPEEIRGYGHVKEASIEKARVRWRELGEAVEPQPIRVAAE